MNSTLLRHETVKNCSDSQEGAYPRAAIIGINVALMLLSISGNLLVIVAVLRTPSLRSPSITLLCGLAASDLLVGFVVQPLFIAVELTVDVSLIHVSFFFGCNCCGVSLGTMTVISLDRFLALHYHMRYVALVTSSGIVSALATLWLVVFLSFGLYFWNPKIYFIVASCFMVSCLFLSSICYIRIFQIVKRHQLQIQAQHQAVQGLNDGNNLNVMQLKRSTINTFIFYIFLILCYFPMFTLMIVDVILQRNAIWSKNLNYSTTVVFMNSSVNPILYCCALKELRKAVLKRARNVFCNQFNQG